MNYECLICQVKALQKRMDKFDTALRLAIAGNIIDFGPNHKFDISEN